MPLTRRIGSENTTSRPAADVKTRIPSWVTLRALAVLDELRFLGHVVGPRNGRQRGYAFPTRRYLAEKAGVNVWTVSRITSRLAAAGYFTKIQPRKRHGRWQPCLYRAIVAAPILLLGVSSYIEAAKQRRQPFHVARAIASASTPTVALQPCALKRSPSVQKEQISGPDPPLDAFFAAKAEAWKRRSSEDPS